MSTTITTEGNLTETPELRVTNTTGTSVTTLRLAVSARRKNIDGEYEDTPPVFYEATVWGQLAEHAVDSLRKGDRVLIHGTSHVEEWTDREGGTRTKNVIQAEALGASLRYSTTAINRPTRAGHRVGSEQPA
jgi:single-strand DNA-binding protein